MSWAIKNPLCQRETQVYLKKTRKVKFGGLILRPGRESNPRIAVLQTAAFPLRHQADKAYCSLSGLGKQSSLVVN